MTRVSCALILLLIFAATRAEGQPQDLERIANEMSAREEMKKRIEDARSGFKIQKDWEKALQEGRRIKLICASAIVGVAILIGLWMGLSRYFSRRKGLAEVQAAREQHGRQDQRAGKQDERADVAQTRASK
jgi:hypothetical protein